MNISERLRPLDALRGVAAIEIACILHWHDNMSPEFPWFKYGLLDGKVLVDLFFMISGLTFTAFYTKRIANNEVSISEFVYSRLVRLVPLHWGSLFLVTLLLFIRKIFGMSAFTYSNNDVHQFVLNLLMIQGDGLHANGSFNAISWTVCIEVLMYLIFFCLCRKTKTKHTYIFCCWLMILLGYSLEKSSFNGNTLSLVDESIGRGMIAFFFGSALYFLLVKLYEFGNRTKVIAFFVLMMIMILGLSGGEEIWCHGEWWYMLTGFVFLVYPLVLYLVTSIEFVRKILMWKPLQYLGSISFTIYMCHYPIQMIFDFFNKVTGINVSYTSYAVWAVYCTMVIGFSAIVHKFYEVPITNWLRKHKQKFWKEENLANLHSV